MKLRPSTDEAIQFLKHLKPTGPWDLVAIGQDGQVTARTFFINEAQEAFAWIEARQGRVNIYYQLNEVKPGIHHRKAKKADIDKVTCLHVDIDNANALEILRTAGLPPPTVTVFSGGGYQPLWRLDPASSNITRAEQANLALARRLGGDKCHNADRLLRLPGTVNIPNAKKRANGRTEIVAAIVSEFTDWKRAYSIDGLLELATGPTTLHTVDESSVSIIDLEGLPPTVLQATKNLILKGDDPHNPIGNTNARYRSRSEVVYRVGCDLARAGCSGEVIAGILMNPQYGISASIREKGSPAKYAARQAAAALDAVSADWPDVTKAGLPKSTFRNAMLAIRRLGLYCDNDEFHKRKSIGGHLLQTFQGELSDDGCAVLRQEIIRAFGFDPTKEHTREAAYTLCLENTYHPIRDYLQSVPWDGVARVETWLSKYLSAEDNQLNRAIGRIMLIAAVRRVRQPGVKFDTIVVLEGRQGTGKSTALRILAGGDRNFSDQEVLALSPKEQMELLEGVWIYEISELEGLKRADTGKVKAFASRSVDRGRPAYGYFKENRPRQCILVGTTNDKQYLRDSTGNRRFWPVATGAIDLVALERDRDQLWAEAALLEEAGHSLILPEELWPVAQTEQDERLEDDPWLEVLRSVSGRVSGAVERIGTSDLLSDKLLIPPERQQQYHLKRLAAVMQKLGWKGPLRLKMSGRVVRGYERPATGPTKDERPFF